MKKPCVLIIFVILFSTISAQNKRTFRIGMEFGNGLLDAEVSDKLYIRQDFNSNDYGYNYNGRRTALEAGYSYVGIKPQASFFNDRLNVYSGLRLMMLSSKIGNKNGRDVFYLRGNNPDAIEFYKISSLVEKNGYLTVPLEVSCNIFRSNIFSDGVYLSGFFKIGGDAGVKIYEKRNIRFRSAEMQIYEQEVLGMIDSEVNRFYATLYSAMGVQLTVSGGVQFSIEGVIPSSVRSKNNLVLVAPDNFSGFQLSVQVPLRFIF